MNFFNYLHRWFVTFVVSFLLLNIQLQVSEGYVRVSYTSSYAEESAPTLDVSTELNSVNRDKVSFSKFIDMLMAMAVGYIAARLVVFCQKLPLDAMVAVGAGIAYITAEIYSLIEFKKIAAQSAKLSVDLSTKEIDDGQLRALEDQKKIYQDMIKTAKIKKGLMQAASVGMLGAAAIAGYRLWTEMGQQISCEPCNIPGVSTIQGIEKSIGPAAAIGPGRISACVALAASAAVTSPAPVCVTTAASCQTFSLSCQESTAVCLPAAVNISEMAQATDAGEINKNSNISLREVSGESRLVNLLIQGENYFVNKGPVLMSTEESVTLKNFQNNKNLDFSIVDQTEWKNKIIDRFLSLLFPSANASSDIMNFLATGLGAIFALTVKGFGLTVDLYLASPTWRTVIFGVMSGIMLRGANQVGKMISTSEDNVRKIDGLINKMKDLQGALSGDRATGNLGAERIDNPYFIPKLGQGEQVLLNDGQPTPCIEQKNGTCVNLSTSFTSSPGFTGLPSGLQSAGTTTLGLAQGLSGTPSLSLGSIDAANSLIGSQGAIKEIDRKVKKELNDLLLKNGKNAIDFDGIDRKVTKDLENSVLKSLKSSNANPSQLLASVANPLEKPTDADIKEFKSAIDSAFAQPIVASTGNEYSADFGLDKFKLDSTANGTETVEVESNTGNVPFEDQFADITLSKDASLFKIIHQRYLKSAYSVLSDRID